MKQPPIRSSVARLSCGSHRPAGSRTRGFTLIEMIVTLGILAGFLTLLSFHLVGLSNIWLNRSHDDSFEQHVEGVTLFLRKALEASETTSGEEDLPVEWERPPGWSDLDDPLLHFRQQEAPALLVREGHRLPAIHAFLHFERETGLSLLWYSDFRAEEIEQTRDLFRTPVSSYVTAVDYAYYEREDDEWEIHEDPMEEDPRDESFRLPDFLRLTFTHPDEGERRRFLLIPQRSPDLPLF